MTNDSMKPKMYSTTLIVKRHKNPNGNEDDMAMDGAGEALRRAIVENARSLNRAFLGVSKRVNPTLKFALSLWRGMGTKLKSSIEVRSMKMIKFGAVQ